MAPKLPLPASLRRPWSGRSLTAPLAAFTMAILLFVYTRTSIQAAKRHAQRHRKADGGQIDWYNESRRRHGQLPTPGVNVVGEGDDGAGAPAAASSEGTEGQKKGEVGQLADMVRTQLGLRGDEERPDKFVGDEPGKATRREREKEISNATDHARKGGS